MNPEEEDNTCHPLEKKSKVSLNAMKGTEEECYAKNSIDRFGDDLMQEILSYLSLKDCFRFECLSKQWKRSVFTTRHSLEVNDKQIDNLSIKQTTSGRVIWKALEPLLKKLPNIRSIDMTMGCEKPYLSVILFERLMKLMKHLNAIHITFVSMDDEILDTILPQYGSRVTSLVFKDYSYNFNKWCHKSCHNLKTLCFDDSEDGLWSVFGESNDILYKSLTQFSFVYSSYNLNAFTLFTDHYTNCLKSIAMILCKLNGKGIEDVLHVLPKLKVFNTISLRIDSIGGKFVINESFTDCLKQIAIDCKLLKRFELTICRFEKRKLRQIYESMKCLTRLRELRLKFESYYDSNNCRLHLNARSLSQCKRLTYLSLDLPFLMISECFFDSIDTHLPRLQSLKLVSRLEMSPRVEEWMQKLPKLRCFDVQTPYPIPFGDSSESDDDY